MHCWALAMISRLEMGCTAPAETNDVDVSDRARVSVVEARAGEASAGKPPASVDGGREVVCAACSTLEKTGLVVVLLNVGDTRRGGKAERNCAICVDVGRVTVGVVLLRASRLHRGEWSRVAQT
jgi:hypothetical protein